MSNATAEEKQNAESILHDNQDASGLSFEEWYAGLPDIMKNDKISIATIHEYIKRNTTDI